MARNYTKVLLITANVGSIFEDFKSDSVPDRMLDLWLNEFLATVKRIDPGFLVVHCQEVGGKNYEESMQHVNQFVKRLLGSPEMQQFDKARVFLDEDFTAVDKFTALGSLYFVHQSIHHVQLFDFQEKKFVPVKGREVLSGNIESVSIKEKAKFPQEFFPDFKWSRKGFLRTRWNICNTIFDLVNIHLFHDASNITAMETTPSTYSRNRRNALRHTIERFENDEIGCVPYFIFGDFNFRLDTRGLIKKLTEKTEELRTKGKKNDVSKIVYTSKDNGKTILTVEKKGFDHQEYHNEVFSNNNNKWLHEYDQEPKDFSDKLYEYEVTFPPSYPFSEDVRDGTSYMKTRCPAWCDRIMCSYDVQELLIQDESPIEYNMIGPNICMGDHKPIYLSFKLRHNAGKGVCIDNGVKGGAVEPAAQEVSEEKPSHATVTKVISINGEAVDVSDMEQVDIHDNATFEQEQYLSEKFNSSGRNSRHKPFGSPTSFYKVAQTIIRVESVCRALKRYHHRSDSESEDDGDAEQQMEPPASGDDDKHSTAIQGDNIDVVSPSSVDVGMTTNNNYAPVNITVTPPHPASPGGGQMNYPKPDKEKEVHGRDGVENDLNVVLDLHNGSLKKPTSPASAHPTTISSKKRGCRCCVVM